MGLGDMMSSVFGGKNDFQAAVTPFLGKPGASPQDVYNNYNQQNQAFQNSINQAGKLKLPQNVLNFKPTRGNLNQEQGLINQVLAMGQGYGPNPALDQLRMTTDQNVQQQAAMAASNRGINPALAARMAGQTGAQMNQQAAGQGALQAAQQQIAAQQLGGNLLGQRVAQQTQQAGMQGQTGLGLLQTRQASEASRRQAQQNYQKMMNDVYASNNAINAGASSQNAATAGQFGMGAMGGLSSMAQGAASMLHEGGEVPNPFQEHVARKMAFGGQTFGSTMGNFLNYQQDPMSAFYGQLGESSKDLTNAGANLQEQMGKSGMGIGKPLGEKIKNAFAPKENLSTMGQTPSLGGMQGTPAIGFGKSSAPAWQTNATLGGMSSPLGQVIPDETLTPPSGIGLGMNTTPAWQNKGLRGDFSLSEGGKVLGSAKVKGDSEKNDTVPALLSPGEVVIPREKMQSPEAAHAFLDKIIQKHQGPDYRGLQQAKEKFHNMAHGGDMMSCAYCHGGGVY